jgi:hypothetical protein
MIREHGLPHYRITLGKCQTGKILVKKSEFDAWLEKTYRQPLDQIVNEIMRELSAKKEKR